MRLLAQDAMDWHKVVSEHQNILSSPPEPLIGMVAQIFVESGVVHAFSIPHEKLRSFLRAVFSMYHQRNSYHNWNHAVHVLSNSYRFIAPSLIHISPLDRLTLLVAAICHDVEHPGVSNARLAELKTEVAVAYNFKSISERHSVVKSLEILDNPACDIFSNMKKADKSTFRYLFEALILATDVADPTNVARVSQNWELHKASVTRGDFSNIDARAAFLSQILLCADISIVVEHTPIFLDGACRLYAETLTYNSVDFDLFAQRQGGFMGGYAKRLFTELHSTGRLKQFATFLDQLEENTQYWKELPDTDKRQIREQRFATA